MFPIQCDHRQGRAWYWFLWPFYRRCTAEATKHLLHYPVWGLSPDVLLLCAEHFDLRVRDVNEVAERARRLGQPIQLSHLIRDAGKI